MTEQPKAATAGWIRIALAVSVALNLLVVGMIAGAALDGRGPGGRAGGKPGPEVALGPVGLRLYAGALPREERRELLKSLRSDNALLRDGRRQLHAHVERLAALLRAEPFSAEAVRAELDAQIGRASELMGYGAEVLTDRFAQMSAADRKAYADAIEQRVRRGERPRR